LRKNDQLDIFGDYLIGVNKVMGISCDLLKKTFGLRKAKRRSSIREVDQGAGAPGWIFFNRVQLEIYVSKVVLCLPFAHRELADDLRRNQGAVFQEEVKPIIEPVRVPQEAVINGLRYAELTIKRPETDLGIKPFFDFRMCAGKDMGKLVDKYGFYFHRSRSLKRRSRQENIGLPGKKDIWTI
jgi:hypothetical protein